MQAASGFDGMGSKLWIADVTSAFDATNTMSVGDVFGKNPKKKARKAVDPSADLAHKKPKSSSAMAIAPTRVASVSTAFADAFGSQQ